MEIHSYIHSLRRLTLPSEASRKMHEKGKTTTNIAENKIGLKSKKRLTVIFSEFRKISKGNPPIKHLNQGCIPVLIQGAGLGLGGLISRRFVAG